jgi:hypothetical protein
LIENRKFPVTIRKFDVKQRTAINLAETARMHGEYYAASSLYRQELEIAREINDRGGEAGCLDGGAICTLKS